MADVFDNELVMADFTQLQSLVHEKQTREKQTLRATSSRHPVVKQDKSHLCITRVKPRLTSLTPSVPKMSLMSLLWSNSRCRNIMNSFVALVSDRSFRRPHNSSTCVSVCFSLQLRGTCNWQRSESEI